jgi:hypothetical protein
LKDLLRAPRFSNSRRADIRAQEHRSPPADRPHGHHCVRRSRRGPAHSARSRRRRAGRAARAGSGWPRAGEPVAHGRARWRPPAEAAAGGPAWRRRAGCPHGAGRRRAPLGISAYRRAAAAGRAPPISAPSHSLRPVPQMAGPRLPSALRRASLVQMLATDGTARVPRTRPAALQLPFARVLWPALAPRPSRA